MSISNKSLHFKLTLLTGILVLIAVATYVPLNHWVVEGQKREVLDQMKGRAQNLGFAISAQFYERYGDPQAFALNHEIFSGGKEKSVETLNAYAATYGIYDLILVVDKSGHLVAANSKSPDGKDINVSNLYKADFSGASWFKNVLAGQFTEDKDKGLTGTYFEDVNIDTYVSSVYGEDRYGTSFSTAIKDRSGAIVGVVSARAGARWFANEFVNAYRSAKTAGLESSDFILVGKDGTVLFEHDPSGTGKDGIVFNKDTLLKYNIVNAAPKLKKILDQDGGATVMPNPIDHSIEVNGVAPIQSAKFVNSIGWSVVARTETREVFAELDHAQHLSYLFSAIVTFVSLVTGYWYSRRLSKDLGSLAGHLASQTDAVTKVSLDLSNSGQSLQDSISQQASAIQETVAAVDEISAMVSKNADNATRSLSNSEKSQNTIREGRTAVEDMLSAMKKINSSNEEVMKQVERNNHEFSEITRVIGEIDSKTKVINDIVFQTKLLSFNASVEAARAGEHGKGFAVVAEEVGNLAQMSGNAAKEISLLLDQSIQKVNEIAENSKKQLDQLMEQTRSAIDEGNSTTKRCDQAFNSIMSDASEVGTMLSEIATATREQSQGVSEINKAMNQLETVTHQNSASAASTADSSKHLKAQADQLRNHAGELYEVVNGKSGRELKGGAHVTSHVPHDVKISKQVHVREEKPKQAFQDTPAKVVPLKQSEPQKPAVKAPSVQPSLRASGDDAVPLSSDSRFEDV